MFGAIYGDVIGSYYEVHYTKDIAFFYIERNIIKRYKILIH